MGFDGAVPEGPGLAGGRGVEKRGEVGGVIVVADIGRGRLRLVLVEGHARQEPRLACRVPRFAGRPAFLRVADKPAVLDQRFAPAFEFQRKIADMVRRLLELPRIAPRDEAGPRRSALRARGVGVGEENALARHAVEGRGLHPLRPVGAAVGAPIIGESEKDVGPRRGVGGAERGEWRKEEGGKNEEGAFHRAGEMGRWVVDEEDNPPKAIFFGSR